MSDDFFPTPRAPEKPEPRPPSPPWSGPPYGTLPGVLALEIVLGQSASAAVYLGRCAAYPTGLDFELHVIASAEAGDELDPSLNGIYHRPGRASSYEGMLRFGVAFADGRKASNLEGHAPTDEQPDGPVLWRWRWWSLAPELLDVAASPGAPRLPSSASGRRPASRRPGSRSTPSGCVRPPGAPVPCSPIGTPGFRVGPGRGLSCRPLPPRSRTTDDRTGAWRRSPGRGPLSSPAPSVSEASI